MPLGLFSISGRQIEKYPGVTVRAPYVVCAYLVRHPDGVVLFDTGIVGDAEAVEHYRPRSFRLDERLASVGTSRPEIDVVVNCHLHADHAGGNHLFAGTPIIVQDTEIKAAAQDDYTVPEACVDFPGAAFQVVSGEYEILPGVAVVPTPGHSPGHQALRVETADGRVVVLAGQAFDDASEFALAYLAHHLDADPGTDVTCPPWMAELADADVVLFAHDLAQWHARPDSYAGTVAVQPWDSSAADTRA